MKPISGSPSAASFPTTRLGAVGVLDPNRLGQSLRRLLKCGVKSHVLLQLGNARLIIRVDELDLPPDFLGYEVAACPSLSLCAHLLDFLRLQCLHSI